MSSALSSALAAELPAILLWLAVTLAIWRICLWLAQRVRVSSLRNPLVFGIIILCVLLPSAGVRAEDYLRAVRPLTFPVSLATVALALPLWQQRALIRANAGPMLLSALASTVAGIGSAVAIGWALGLEPPHLASMAPRMTTLAVALPLSASTGGWASLTMLCVMANGIGGAFISSAVWKYLAPQSGPEERAFALGLASHAMGIARTLALNPECISLASCGMLLSALVTVVLYGLADVVFAMV